MDDDIYVRYLKKTFFIQSFMENWRLNITYFDTGKDRSFHPLDTWIKVSLFTLIMLTENVTGFV